MENLEFILSLCGTVVGLIITLFTIIVQFSKNKKAKKIAEFVVKIGNAVVPYIKEAEKFSSYTGAEKKAFVMTKANQFAISQKIPFNEDQVSDKIEELVTLTKQVNIKNAKNEKIKNSEVNSGEILPQSSWL